MCPSSADEMAAVNIVEHEKWINAAFKVQKSADIYVVKRKRKK